MYVCGRVIWEVYLLTTDREESVHDFSIGRRHAFKGGVSVLGDVYTAVHGAFPKGRIRHGYSDNILLLLSGIQQIGASEEACNKLVNYY